MKAETPQTEQTPFTQPRNSVFGDSQMPANSLSRRGFLGASALALGALAGASTAAAEDAAEDAAEPKRQPNPTARKKLRIGLVGLGFGGQFLNAMKDSEHVGAIVLCDSDAERMKQTKSASPLISSGYTDLSEMLDKEKLDAVIVVTPDHLHRPHAEICFEAGVHLLLTKPMACTLADGRAILKAAEKTDRIFMVAQERRFRKSNIALKKMLVADDFGQVIHVRSDIIMDKQPYFRQKPWYASKEAGRTPIVGTGIHEVDMLRHFIGSDIISVAAFGNRFGDMEFPTDKTTVAIFKFRNGAVGQVTTTYVAKPKKGRSEEGNFLLSGTKGGVEGHRFARNGSDQWEKLPKDFYNNTQEGVSGCVHEFIDTLITGKKPPVSGRDAFASLAACIAADQSSATGQMVQPEVYGS